MAGNKTLIGLRSFLSSVGATAASTFVGIYAVILGAGAIEMGWLQSSFNSISNGAQLLWGKLSDRTGRRKVFLFIGSLILAFLWFLMPFSGTPYVLIITYSSIALFGSMITVNWFSLIADMYDSSIRGKFLAFINNISSIGTILSLLLMVMFFGTNPHNDIKIPFFLASGTYLVSAVVSVLIKEERHSIRFKERFSTTLRNMKNDLHFYRYFMATNVQGFFWSMAWPMFPITIVSVMHFSLQIVAILTVITLSVSIMVQYFLGKITDRKERPPLIYLNRVMLSLIPICYAFFNSLTLFILLEIYSGFLGALQNIVLTSYMLDVVPSNRKGEYIALINGFNGLVYLMGALVGGYLLQFAIDMFPLRTALEVSYMIVFGGRFMSSFLFLRLKEPENKGRTPIGLFSILYREKLPGNPSGGTIKMK